MDHVPGLRVERPRDGVVLVTFDRQERYNALDGATIAALPELFDSIGADPTIRALVLTGAGRAFCAGADLGAVKNISGQSQDRLETWMAQGLRTPLALREIPQPTIAAVNGPAAGGGLVLALACDIRIAGPAAHFSSPFIRMALVPDIGVSWLLPRLVGEAHALEMMLSARRVGAEEAQAIGLVSRVVEDPLADALELATTIADMSLRAVAATKQMTRNAAGIDLAAAIAGEVHHQGEALRSADFSEHYARWRAAIIGPASPIEPQMGAGS